MGGGVVYLLAPSILGVLAASDQLVEIDWYWLVALLVAQAGVLVPHLGAAASADRTTAGARPRRWRWWRRRSWWATRSPPRRRSGARPAPRPRSARCRGVGSIPGGPRRASSPSRCCRSRRSGRSPWSARSWSSSASRCPRPWGAPRCSVAPRSALITGLLVVALRTDRVADWLGVAAGVVLRRDPKRDRRDAAPRTPSPPPRVGRTRSCPQGARRRAGPLDRRLPLPAGGGRRGQPRRRAPRWCSSRSSPPRCCA